MLNSSDSCFSFPFLSSGVPKSVVRDCQEVVSLESVNYGSYNVAVAGSIVMYDRMMKLKRAEAERNEKKRQGKAKKNDMN